ncbi:MAG: hypothetical protein WA634_04415 [Silvibacterium sp.]
MAAAHGAAVRRQTIDGNILILEFDLDEIKHRISGTGASLFFIRNQKSMQVFEVQLMKEIGFVDKCLGHDSPSMQEKGAPREP